MKYEVKVTEIAVVEANSREEALVKAERIKGRGYTIEINEKHGK